MTLENNEKESSEDVQRNRSRTLAVTNTTMVVNSADGSLFPVVMSQVQDTLGMSIGQVSLISSFGSFLQAATTPIWGWANDRYSRKKVLGIGCAIWGALTIMMALSMSFIDMLVYRALTGIGLAVIVPTANSLIADYYPATQRGKAYGILNLTGVFGMLIGAIIASVIVQLFPTILGVYSWRIVFIAWGVASVVIAGLVFILAKDPSRGQMDVGFTGKEMSAEKPTVKLSDYKTILKNKTFLLICTQGVAGSIPFNGLLFLPTWLQYVGFPLLNAMLLFIIVAFGAAAGTVFGGWFGDRAAKWSPNHGRIMTAQISVFSGIPLVVILFFAIPPNTSASSVAEMLAVGIAMGFFATWAGNACNAPIFSEIFAPEIRGSAFSVDRVFEGSIASFGTFFIGLAAAAFGFQTPTALDGQFPNLYKDSLRLPNLTALTLGIFTIMIIPWILCLILYTLVYLTYPKDFKKMHDILEARAAPVEHVTETSGEIVFRDGKTDSAS